MVYCGEAHIVVISKSWDLQSAEISQHKTEVHRTVNQVATYYQFTWWVIISRYITLEKRNIDKLNKLQEHLDLTELTSPPDNQ